MWLQADMEFHIFLAELAAHHHGSETDLAGRAYFTVTTTSVDVRSTPSSA